ncbi:MAG: hypothetical protein AB1489_42340 [Acidobacteriota bacterium]
MIIQKKANSKKSTRRNLLWVQRILLWVIFIGCLTTVAVIPSTYYSSLEQESLERQLELINQQISIKWEIRQVWERLWMVVSEEDVETLEAIPEIYSSPNITDVDGNTLLLKPIVPSGPEMTKTLLNLGVNPNLRSYDGNYLLSDLVTDASISWNSRDGELIQLLVSRGAALDMLDEHGEPVLYGPTIFGTLPLIDLLLAAGADVNAKNHHGEALIFAAIDVQRVSIVEKLVGAGADLTSINRHGETVYEFAKRRDVCPLIYPFPVDLEEGPIPPSFMKVPKPDCDHQHHRICELLVKAGAWPVELEQQINTEQRRPFAHMPWILRDALEGMY